MGVDGRSIRFGLFEVDLTAAELRKNGVKIKLQDQPFQVLLRLLEQPGSVVTREELRIALWPDGTFVDFDHSLNASINKLRDALEDSATNPRFIQTLPRRGYRFIAPVEVPAGRVAAPVGLAEDDVPIERAASRRFLAVVLSVALIAAAVAAAVMLHRSDRSGTAAVVVPLTSTPGLELEPSFSPDGNFIVYAGRQGYSKTSSLYVKSLRSESPRPVTSSNSHDKSPKWSPDGRRIAFVRFSPAAADDKTAPGILMTIPPFGGAERVVPNGGITILTGWAFSLLDWFNDSEHLVVSAYMPGREASSLFVVNARTGSRHQITEAPEETYGDVDPAVSSDGRRVTFTRQTSHQLTEVWAVDLTPDRRPAGAPRPLVKGIGAKSAAWTADGREIIFAAGSQHKKRLMRMSVIPLSPPRPMPFAAEGSYALAPAVSRRNQIAYPLLSGKVQMYRSDLGPDGLAIRTAKMPLSSVLDHLPDFSPSGDRLAWVSNRSGVQEIWVGKADGSDAYQLTDLQGHPEATHPRWSPNSEKVVFTGGGKAWIVDVRGGQPVPLIDDGNEELGAAAWSLDGKGVYVVSHRSGRAEIWKMPASGRQGSALDRQITKGGGGSPVLSPDGKFLYYAEAGIPAALRRVPTEGGTEEVVIQQVAHGGAFTVGAAGVYFIPPVLDEIGTSVMLLDVRTGAQKRVAPVAGHPMWGMAVSPDGRTLLHVALEFPDSDLMLVENFR